MWSDTATPDQLNRAVDIIRSVLPGPAAGPDRGPQRSRSRANPEQVANLLRTRPGFVWLDGNDSRHFLLSDPLATISCDRGCMKVTAAGRAEELDISSLDGLEAALRAWKGSKYALLAGFISYDVADEIEKVGRFEPLSPGFPRLHMGLYDSALVFDDEGWSVAATEGWRGSAAAFTRINASEDLLRRAEAYPCECEDPAWQPLAIEQQSDRKFLRSVEAIRDRIHNGDFFQTNICRLITAQTGPALAWQLYLRMRRIGSACYGAYLQLDPDKAVLSMSPELFLKVNDRVVESHPIKGTRARGCDEVSDRLARTDLVESEKDAAELAMIVDVVRNDLSRVCEPGSVNVLHHRSLMELPSICHTYSRVAGRMQHDKTVADLLRASFPPASISGAPKIAAVQAALHEEGFGRGPCMGSVGWIAMDGSVELSVAIRTAFIHGSKAYYMAGCGITSDSIAEAELAEYYLKAAVFLKASS